MEMSHFKWLKIDRVEYIIIEIRWCQMNYAKIIKKCIWIVYLFGARRTEDECKCVGKMMDESKWRILKKCVRKHTIQCHGICVQGQTHTHMHLKFTIKVIAFVLYLNDKMRFFYWNDANTMQNLSLKRFMRKITENESKSLQISEKRD